MREGSVTLWQQHANEVADEQAKKGEVSGTHSRFRETQRMERRDALGAEAAPCAAWEAGGFPKRTAKEEGHARAVLDHADAGEDW